MSPLVSRPVPEPVPWSRHFWDAARERKLVIQQCSDCGARIFYPREFCTRCHSANVRWIEASGRAEVYTFTVVRAYPPSAFATQVPYVLAIVRLEEGVQMMGNIVECQPEEVRCGMPVEVTFMDTAEGVTLPVFRPRVSQ